MFQNLRFSWIVFSAALMVSLVVGGWQRAFAGDALVSSDLSRAAAVVEVAEATSPQRMADSLLATALAQTDAGEFVLPPLTYAYDALEPYVDEQTMMIHHDKHHAGYVKNLNTAIADYPELQGQPLASLLGDLESVPAAIRTTIQNNGGGHANHTMFWETMTPNGQGVPSGAIAEAITANFGDFETFQQAFDIAGKKRFGSGWAWLVLTEEGTLEVMSTANQDSPLSMGRYPLMGNDVWEHAYYLNYQNRRGDYLAAWWNLVDWDVVNGRYEQALSAIAG